MFIDKISLVDSCQVLSPLADHSPTLMKLNFLAQPIPRRQEAFRNFTDTAVSELNLAFHSTNWSPVLHSVNLQMALDCWPDIVLSTLDKFAPLQVKMNRPANKPWYSPYLCRLRRVRDRLFNRSKHLSHSNRLRIVYRKVRNLYVSARRKAERLHSKQIGSTLSSSLYFKANSHRWSFTVRSSSESLPLPRRKVTSQQ